MFMPFPNGMKRVRPLPLGRDAFSGDLMTSRFDAIYATFQLIESPSKRTFFTEKDSIMIMVERASF